MRRDRLHARRSRRHDDDCDDRRRRTAVEVVDARRIRHAVRYASCDADEGATPGRRGVITPLQKCRPGPTGWALAL